MATDKPKRVLLAEDSAVTQDIVKLVLGQRGHTIDIANDGQEAFEMLSNNSYDLALIDFHLPVRTGLDAVTEFLSQREGEMIPRLIALTGDTAGLLEADNNANHFDLVVSKPFKIDQIIPIIESEESVPRIYNPEVTNAMASQPEKVEKLPYDELDLYLIHFPRDFYGSFKNAVSMRLNSEGAPDAIIVHKEPTAKERGMIASLKGTHGSPIIDLTGKLGKRADISEGEQTPGELTVRALIEKFDEQRRQIHTDLHQPETDGEALIVRMFSAKKELNPHYDGAETLAIHYNTIMPNVNISEAVPDLVKTGLLESTFFDRINHCPQCDSARILAREECQKCRSSNLREEFYLHHYRCAWQGPQSDFKSGDDLVCPKCRYELVHFGKDYDKPGSMMICNDCGHISTDPDVGFMCVDCNTHTTGENIIAKDIKKYKLTDKAMELIEAGRVVLGETRKSFRFADLPIDMIVELNTMAKDYMDNNKPFSMMSIGYKNLRALERERGVRACDQAREMLTNLLRESIENYSRAASGVAYDYIIVRDITKEPLTNDMEIQLAQAMKSLSLPLEPVISVFGADELGG